MFALRFDRSKVADFSEQAEQLAEALQRSLNRTKITESTRRPVIASVHDSPIYSTFYKRNSSDQIPFADLRPFPHKVQIWK